MRFYDVTSWSYVNLDDPIGIRHIGTLKIDKIGVRIVIK